MDKTKIKLKENIALREKDKTLYLLDVETLRVYEFNSFAREIIMELSEQKAIGDVLRYLSEKYEQPESDIYDDVVQFINELRRSGLLIEASLKITLDF